MERSAGGRYLAYMLRLRQTLAEEAPIWRASLESVASGELRRFANLRELFAFLVATTEGRDAASGAVAPPEERR